MKSTQKVLTLHFKKNLSSNGVHILDPATGTGTFITEILEHIYNSDKEVLKQKYQNEIHANEISVLPYYVANLNIEYTYKTLTKERLAFPNLVLMDSLQNSGFSKDKFYWRILYLKIKKE